MKKLGGVVFDMDGVVIDSEITHYTAICEAMGEGATASFDQFLEHCTGRDEVYAMTRMAELSGMNLRMPIWHNGRFGKARPMPGWLGSRLHPFLGPLNWFYRWRKNCRLVWLRVPAGMMWRLLLRFWEGGFAECFFCDRYFQ